MKPDIGSGNDGRICGETRGAGPGRPEHRMQRTFQACHPRRPRGMALLAMVALRRPIHEASSPCLLILCSRIAECAKRIRARGAGCARRTPKRRAYCMACASRAH